MGTNKFTSGPWFPVDYAGFWNIRNTPFYDDGVDVTNAEDVGIERAKNNAILCASAPELLEALSICTTLIKSIIGDSYIPETALQLLEKLKIENV